MIKEHREYVVLSGGGHTYFQARANREEVVAGAIAADASLEFVGGVSVAGSTTPYWKCCPAITILVRAENA